MRELNVISQAKIKSTPGNSSLNEKLELKSQPVLELAGWKTFVIQTSSEIIIIFFFIPLFQAKLLRNREKPITLNDAGDDDGYHVLAIYSAQTPCQAFIIFKQAYEVANIPSKDEELSFGEVKFFPRQTWI